MNISRKNLIAILIGNGLEYYDLMLFGFFAGILAPLFFPNDNISISLISSMGTYWVGFLARPLGGVVFGHFGDRWGRRNILSTSILLLIFPTLAIGLLPTYELIGIWAPVLLIFCRFSQGLCLGGEASGAITYLTENVTSTQKDIMSAWYVVSCYVGMLIGTLLCSIFLMPFMPSWGWRLMFVLEALVAFIGYYFRKKLKISPEFSRIQKRKEILRFPLKTLLINEKLHLMHAAGHASAVIVPFFIIYIYLSNLLIKEVSLEPSTVLLLNAGLLCFWIALLPIFGFLAQRYGRAIVMMGGLLGMAIFSYPLFLNVACKPTLENILITQYFLSFFAIAYAAPTSAVLADLFPVNQRYSGIAVGYSFGHAFIGGFIPILLTILTESFQFTLAPVLFIYLSCFIGASFLINDFFEFARAFKMLVLQKIFPMKK